MTIAPSLNLLPMLYQFYRDPLGMFVKAHQNWGDVVRFSIPSYTLYQVTSPTLVERVLTHPHYELSGAMGSSLAFVGNGLATNTSPTWASHRRLMQPAFHKRAISRYTEQITQTIYEAGSTWTSPLNLAEAFVRLNHQILGQVILGIDFRQYPAELAALATIRHYVNRRVNAVMGLPEITLNPRYQNFQRAIQRFDAFLKPHLANPQSGSLLELLTTARDPKTDVGMSADQVRDEINTAFFNAYDDPASALSWAIALLAQHPQVEQKLREEIGQEAPTFEHLQELSYTRQIINEVLRLYPPTWSMLRDVVQDDDLGGYQLEKGTAVLVNTYILQRDPAHWTHPNEFIPERFSQKIPNNIYIPFGFGPRQCIGRDLALLQMSLMLVCFVQKFRFQVIGDFPTMQAANSLKPSHLMVQLVKNSD